MRIVLGVDGSSHSQAAVDYIKRMEWPPNTSVLVISVAMPQVIGHTMVEAGGIGLLKAVRDDGVRLHEEIADRIERDLCDAGLQARAQVAQGDPRDVLVHAAGTERADLLVVGSHGRTGLARLMMGSVASHVATHAPCTVLVVKLNSGAMASGSTGAPI